MYKRTTESLAAILVCHEFATVRLRLIRFMQRIRDFSSREFSFHAAKADYASYVALGRGLRW